MPSVSRRFVLIGAPLASASLCIPIASKLAGAAKRRDGADVEITDWIVIAASGQVTLGLSQPEVGQGSYTALPQILADELDADWARVKIRFVTGRPAYRIAFRQEPPAQKEGASMSTAALYDRLRSAGAAARDVLVRTAATKWRIDVSGCRTETGFVFNRRGDKLSYGELAGDAAKLPLSKAPPLKAHDRFHLVGKPVARLDTPAKSNGSATYGIDVVVPEMLNAAIKTAPSFTGRVIAIKNEAGILKMPGVRGVVKLPASIAEDAGASHAPPRDNAVCVVADYFWQAKRAVDALDVAFDGGEHGDLSTAKIDAMLDAALNSEDAVVAMEHGDPREILKRSASAVIERRFKLPHIAHAPHEPVNATASYRDGKVEVWGPIQSVTACQEAVAEAVGCRVDDVAVHVTFLGGSFGRKIVPDFVVQAVHASKAVGRPIKLIRTREEDMQHDVYRPNAAGLLRAVLDERGYPLAIKARVVGQSLFAATRKSWLDQTPHGAWDESMVDGIYNQSYRVPHFLVETVDTPLPVPVYFMRSVGSTAAVFFWESLITELAHRANIDQYAYRRSLLSVEPLAAGARRGRRGVRLADVAASGHGPRHRLQLLRRPGRPISHLRRGGRRAPARRRALRGEARLLRGRCGPRRQPEHPAGSDRGRHRLRDDDGPQERDHLLERRHRSEQLLRLPAARHRRDARGRSAHSTERSSAAGRGRSGPRAGGSRDRAGAVARHRAASRRDAVPRRGLSIGGRATMSDGSGACR
jgi:isoquinoline 1-oxidoreductase subunit beta